MRSQQAQYNYLVGGLLLAILIGSTLPLYNVLVVHPAMVKLMQGELEQWAIKASRHLVTDFTPLSSQTFLKTPTREQVRTIQQLITDYEIHRFKLFSPTGLIVYSNRPEEFGKTNQNDYFHQRVAQGKTVNKLVADKQTSLEGDVIQRDVAEIYIPVMNQGEFLGAFEFYFDVTAQKKALDEISQSSLRISLAIILGFLILLIIFAVKLRQALLRSKEKEERILKMAYTDILTGLPNRRLLMDRMTQVFNFAKRNKHLAAVLYFDIDFFKSVNDKYGHQEGDNLLSCLAQRISRQIRDSDTLARIGGDEFVLLAPDLQRPEEARVIAQSLKKISENPYTIRGEQIQVSFSVGIALYPTDGTTPEQLLKLADSAMYLAKEKGRNTFAVHGNDP